MRAFQTFEDKMIVLRVKLYCFHPAFRKFFHLRLSKLYSFCTAFFKIYLTKKLFTAAFKVLYKAIGLKLATQIVCLEKLQYSDLRRWCSLCVFK